MGKCSIFVTFVLAIVCVNSVTSYHKDYSTDIWNKDRIKINLTSKCNLNVVRLKINDEKRTVRRVNKKTTSNYRDYKVAIFPLNDRFKGREATNSYPQARNFHKVWFHTPEETNPNIGLGACVFKIGTSLEIPMKSPINNHTSITILWFLNYKEMDPSEYDNDFHHSFMDFQANKGEKSNYALHGFGFRTHMVASPASVILYHI